MIKNLNRVTGFPGFTVNKAGISRMEGSLSSSSKLPKKICSLIWFATGFLHCTFHQICILLSVLY